MKSAKNSLLILLFLSVTAGCARSAEQDLNHAVETHIQAKTSEEADGACRSVFEGAKKRVKDNESSADLCNALSKISDTELSICEDEVLSSEYSSVIKECKPELLKRIGQVKKDRNEGTSTTTTLNFKIPFEVQYRDLSQGYTAVTGDTKNRQVILTFDDGPHPLSTKVSQILERVGVKAHFFQLGKQVKIYPEITKYLAARGHSIANHSWDHANFAQLSLEEQIKQVSDTQKIIIETIGWIDPFFRYPYGSKTTEMNQFLKSYQIANFLWSIDSNDWRKINADKTIRTNAQVINETLEQLDRRGRGLVLFHDVHARTVELLPEFLVQLKKKGYQIVLLQASNTNLKNAPLLP